MVLDKSKDSGVGVTEKAKSVTKTPKREKKFNPKHSKIDRFVEEYFVDYNATAAAIRAGYSPKTANVQASQLLAKLSVQEKIEAKRAQLARTCGIDPQRVLDETAKLAFANAKNFLGVSPLNGEVYLKNIAELPPELTAAISEVTMNKVTIMKGKEVEERINVKFKLHDKKGPLELLGQTVGVFKKEVDTLRVQLVNDV